MTVALESLVEKESPLATRSPQRKARQFVGIAEKRDIGQVTNNV